MTAAAPRPRPQRHRSRAERPKPPALSNTWVGAGALAALCWVAGVTADALVSGVRSPWPSLLLSAEAVDSHVGALVVGLLSVPLLRRHRRALLEARRLMAAEASLARYRAAESEKEAAAEEVRARISSCLTGDGPTVVAQPIYDIVHRRRVVGYEALARFPDGRPPDIWFAEARQVRLSEDLELRAAANALELLALIPSPTYLSLNISPDVLLSEAFLSLFDEVAADRCVIELTEHCHVESYEDLHRAIDRLRRMGARIAVDDAGAGFASFRHIVQLAPDIIKLDRDLIRRCNVDPVRRTLAAALVGFARQIDASLIAEGVETAGELAALREMGVRRAQGYYLGRPAPLPLGDPAWEVVDLSASRSRAAGRRPRHVQSGG